MGSGHDAYRGECMVWAFDRVHGGLIRIAPGQADRLRARGHAGDLVCPVGDCPSPEFRTRRGYTTAAGTYVADGFRHRSAPTPAHEPESLAHITGKLVVAQWLGRTGWTEVHLERRDTQSGRTPDVTAVRAGRRLAVEVQFARPTVDEWSARTEALEASGFEVLWLWGAHSTTGTTDRLSAAQAEMVRQGRLVVWLCPDEERFAVAAVTRRARPRKRSPESDLLVLPDPGDVIVSQQWSHASGVRVERSGLTHPALDALARRTEWLRRVRLGELVMCLGEYRRRMERNEAARMRAQQQPQLPAPAARQHWPKWEQPSVLAEPMRIPKARVGVRGPFAMTEEDERVLEAAGLAWLVAAEDPCDRYVYQPVRTWHPAIVLRLLRRPTGTKVRMATIGEAVEDHTNCEIGRGTAAVTGQLRLLEKAGWIRTSRGTVTIMRSLQPEDPDESVTRSQPQLFDP